jgi:hypothetical protein
MVEVEHRLSPLLLAVENRWTNSREGVLSFQQTNRMGTRGFSLLSTNAKILGRRLTCPGRRQLVPDLGTLGEARVAYLLDRRNMDENIRASWS